MFSVRALLHLQKQNNAYGKALLNATKSGHFETHIRKPPFLRSYQPAMCYSNNLENITKYEAKRKAES